MTIGLLGDVMLGRQVARALDEGPAARVWSDELAELCRSCDALVCNLECCISERGSETERIPGKPFFFRAPPAAAVEALATVGTVAVSLANNHALDYEEQALLDTLDHLSAAGIATAGAGRDLDSARRGALVEAGGRRVGLLAATDHPAEYAAGEEKAGVAYADLRSELPDWIGDELARLRGEADLVLAFPHWGPNMSTEPARWQRKRAEELIAAGADLVAGHSAHVFHGIGRIDGRPVLFDLGDALDDYRVDRKRRNDLGILALWRPGGDPEIELVGLRLEYCETELARGKDADWIAARLEKACAELGTRLERTGEQRFALTAGNGSGAL
ncbi:MAG TPA: CapA family protein [Thermoleophilaceae bacterium]|nr:CapA family protein [Thermoleophilaceae bacterium]